MVIRQPAPVRDSDDWSEYDGRAMSVEEFLALDDAEETDLEYIDGIVREKAVVDRAHGNLAGELAYHFALYRRQSGGEQGPERRVRLSNGRYVKPDIAYWAALAPKGNDTLPTLAVEIRSPSETVASQRLKCRMYIEAGVPEVWLIDPGSRTFYIFTPEIDAEPLDADGAVESPLLPGFHLPLGELFARARH
jgi:Uma2 family endonuclease